MTGPLWKSTLIWCVVAAACLASSPVGAAIITYGPTLHDNGGAGYGNGATGSFLVPQFDDLAGALTLTKVTLTVQIDGTGGSRNSIMKAVPALSLRWASARRCA
ncbi:MAG: hypothetical protein KA383_06825 [Phycisphaerae bacterium]|nr:hypothetical protein [Phycisphaerae bacterium]